MSGARPPRRPTMHADLPLKWLKCDNHSEVTQWYMSSANRRRYPLLYSSFVNTAAKAWQKSTDPKAKQLNPLEASIVDCLLMDPIPAEDLIEVLKNYNKLIGGLKGDLKSTGLIKWDEEHPKDAEIEKGVDDLYTLIAATRNSCSRAEATTNGGAEDDEDEDMEDVEMEDEQTMPSLNDMGSELSAAANAPTAVKDKGKGKESVKFGDLPYVGKKKDDEDNDKEWKEYFLMK